MTLISSFIVGILPTMTMMICSLVVMKSDNTVPEVIQRYVQNLSGGLIVGAVACDLIPMLNYDKYHDLSYLIYVIAIGLGFILGFAMLHCFDVLAESVECQDIEEIVLETCNASKPSNIIKEMRNSENLQLYNAIELGNYGSTIQNSKPDSEDSDFEDSPAFDPEDEQVAASLHAFLCKSDHRANIEKNINSLIVSIDQIDSNMDAIIEIVDHTDVTKVEDEVKTATRSSEELAESIDREVHILQYKLDHCRRLLQGSFSDTTGSHIILEKWNSSRLELKKRLFNLKFIAKHLLQHMNDSNLNASMLREMHNHMHDMDKQIEKFHNTVEISSFKWKRRKELPIPIQGSTVPPSLIIPILIDAMVDGFMIGLTSVMSFRAGFVLSVATSLEMAFLGIAVSVRVKRCTASSTFVRYASVIFPPILVVVAAIIGSFIVGSISSGFSFYFVLLLATGIYCLLNLVFDELLVEARSGLTIIPWHLSCMTFLGLFITFALNSI